MTIMALFSNLKDSIESTLPIIIIVEISSDLMADLVGVQYSRNNCWTLKKFTPQTFNDTWRTS